MSQDHQQQQERSVSVSKRENKTEKQEETKYQKKKQNKQKQEDSVAIPVKNYRSRSRSRREPSPPVDYPAGADYSDDTDETDVRLADYENNDKKQRRKSVQSFSKKTSVTRQYPGCVIS